MLKKIKKYYLNIKSKILTPRINRDIKKYKYVHVMFNDKFNKPFVDFLNENFDITEHMVLFCKVYKDKPPTLVPRGKNVYEYVYFKDIKGLLGDNIDKIIFHSLFRGGVVDRLYSEPELLKKSYWGIWGGDLYNAPRDEKNDFVRKNFKGYVTDLDDEYLCMKYKIKNKHIFPIYSIPRFSLQDIFSIKKCNKKYVQIQINNSCDESTLEMLDILSKYKDENIKITTVLSYGKLDYKEQIIKKGKEIYGEKFEYLDKLLSPEEYLNYLAQNDILILYQNRQQGINNLRMALALKIKVFVKSNTTTYAKLLGDNIKVYDSSSIKLLSYEDFIVNDKTQIQNDNIKKYFDLNYIKKQCEDLFNDK